MIASIFPGWITSLLALLGGGMLLLLRYFKKRDDPQNQYQSAKDENAKAVTEGDTKTIDRKLSDLTDNGV